MNYKFYVLHFTLPTLAIVCIIFVAVNDEELSSFKSHTFISLSLPALAIKFL